MLDNIRSTDPTLFEGQDWLTPKVRVPPGTATPDEIAHKATAEWANAVDDAQREINRAFFGFPQQAVNTRGWVRGSNTALTGVGPDHTKTILLVRNILDAEFVQIDVVIAARHVGTPRSGSHHEVALFQLTGGAFVRQATELSVDQAAPADLTWLAGADAVFPVVVNGSTLAVTVTGPTFGEPVRWTVDFSIRSGPAGLP